jgi:hypothetical protein
MNRFDPWWIGRLRLAEDEVMKRTDIDAVDIQHEIKAFICIFLCQRTRAKHEVR